MTFKKIIFLMAITVISSCDESDSGDAITRAVVQSYLTPGKRIEVTISKEGFFEDGTFDSLQFIDGLTVNVTEGNNTYPLTSIGEGNYISDEHIAVTSEAVYALALAYGNKEITATTYVPSKPIAFEMSTFEIVVDRPEPGTGPPTLPDPVELSWDNPDNDYHLVVVKVIEENPEKIAAGAIIVGREFRNEPNTGTTYSISPMRFEYYGMHAVVLYKLNAEYTALYEETGSSSLNLKSPFSNVRNGLGIFTGINSDTLYLNVKKP